MYTNKLYRRKKKIQEKKIKIFTTVAILLSFN